MSRAVFSPVMSCGTKTMHYLKSLLLKVELGEWFASDLENFFILYRKT
jgi:hypothetical protein